MSTPIERLREAAAVPADDVTVERTDLAAILERVEFLEGSVRELCALVTGYDGE